MSMVLALGNIFILIAFVKVSLVLFMIDLFCRTSHYIIVIVSISGDRFESQINIQRSKPGLTDPLKVSMTLTYWSNQMLL